MPKTIRAGSANSIRSCTENMTEIDGNLRREAGTEHVTIFSVIRRSRDNCQKQKQWLSSEGKRKLTTEGSANEESTFRNEHEAGNSWTASSVFYRTKNSVRVRTVNTCGFVPSYFGFKLTCVGLKYNFENWCFIGSNGKPLRFYLIFLLTGYIFDNSSLQKVGLVGIICKLAPLAQNILVINQILRKSYS